MSLNDVLLHMTCESNITRVHVPKHEPTLLKALLALICESVLVTPNLLPFPSASRPILRQCETKSVTKTKKKKCPQTFM